MADKRIIDLEAAIEKMRVELREPLVVASLVFNLISPLVELPAEDTRLPKDLIVRSLLLERVQNDLRCCMLLAERGFPIQACALAAGIYEGFATIGAIVDEAAANKSLEHDKEEVSFGPTRNLARESFENIAQTSEGADRVYDEYRERMPKHLNPIVERTRGYRIDEQRRLIFTPGPDTTERAVQQAWFALEPGSRAAFMAVIAFINKLDALPPIELRNRVDAAHEASLKLQSLSFERWADHYTLEDPKGRSPV